MLAQNVINPALVERLLHAGAVGFGWINAAWGIGALLSAALVPVVMRSLGAQRGVAVCMAVLAISTCVVPFSGILGVAIALFLIMGMSRGIAGVAVNSRLMEVVPKYYMGRVQNIFAFAARALQMSLGMAVGLVAHRFSLTAAFLMIGVAYFLGCTSAGFAKPPAAPAEPEPALEQVAGVD
jgi:MFS family permease